MLKGIILEGAKALYKFIHKIHIRLPLFTAEMQGGACMWLFHRTLCDPTEPCIFAWKVNDTVQ